MLFGAFLLSNKMGQILSSPLVCGLATAFSTWTIFSFWSYIFTYKRKIPHIIMPLLAILNGVMAMFSQMYTNNNASPRTIAVYMPIMIVLQLLIFGHVGKWGTAVILALTSFQFITLYSVSIGLVGLYSSHSFLTSRNGLIVPVTLMNIFMGILLFGINIYRLRHKNRRDDEIGMIISNPRQSSILFIYSIVNSVAVTTLAYAQIRGIFDIINTDYHVRTICRDMVVRDIILFFSTILMLDIQSRNLKAERSAGEMRKAATTDDLTGLLNRREFERLLLEHIEKESSGALFMFDLDNFKNVNDNLGHPKGDELLIDVADILRDTFRAEDLICRVGGDEFFAFAKGFTDENLIAERATRLNELGRKSLDTPTGECIKVSFSIGIAILKEEEKDVNILYFNADKALYGAKENGRDCYKIYSN